MTPATDPAARLIELANLHRKIEDEIRRVSRLVDGEMATSRRSPRDVPACGTETGYQRHRYRGETCDECRVAHAAHNRAADARRRARKVAAA